MTSRLIGTVAAAAVLSSCLSVGLMQVLSTAPAGAATSVTQTTTPPTDIDLLTEIAANTSTSNAKLHVIGGDLLSILAEDKKIESLSDLSAKRLRYLNTNLAGLYEKFSSVFAYSDPYRKSYAGNEMRTLVASVCEAETELAAQNADSGKIVNFPPCGK